MKTNIRFDTRSVYRHLMTKQDAGNELRTLIPPHPDLEDELIKEINKLRKSKSIMSEKITIRNTKPVGMDDGLIYPGTLYPVGTTAAIARAGAADRAPLTGTVRIIVVLVNFSDKTITQPVSHYQQLFFSLGTYATGSLREYFREVSNNSVDIQGQVVGPYTLSHSQSYYANNNYGTGNTLPNARTMALEAAQLSDPAVNYANYDNDNDSYVDAFIVLHAGSGAEVTGNKNDIWSHKWVLQSTYNTADADGEVTTSTSLVSAIRRTRCLISSVMCGTTCTVAPR